MNKSESIKELASALSKAQGEFAGAAKDSTNPHFKSKYADLESVVAAIKPHLSENCLSFIQTSHNDSGCAAIETIILHASGEWISCGVVSVPVSKADAQGYGSAMTYARRYSLAAAFGVAPEDDDGNAASKSPGKTAQKDERTRMTIADLKKYSTDKVDGDGVVIKFSAKSLIEQQEKTAQNLIDFLSAKYILPEDVLREIQSWERSDAN